MHLNLGLGLVLVLLFGVGFGFWVGFGFCFGIAFESDLGGGSKLCNVFGMVNFCLLYLGYVFEIGFWDGFWVWGWV